MAKNELIRDFELIRNSLRQFYVYGFKTRNEYDEKSIRTYHNDCRLMENWLEDFMSVRRDKSGTVRFITIDSAVINENPFYRPFKAKSFTDKSITLHFCLMDILADGEYHSLTEISDRLTKNYTIDNATCEWEESTLRKKLREYEELGIVESMPDGRKKLYRSSRISPELTNWLTAISFFSEVFPLGVVGSYILDKYPNRWGRDILKFKHHYLLSALDSQVMYDLICAIGKHCSVELKTYGTAEKVLTVLPLKIYIGTQTGRSYLLAYNYPQDEARFYRLDRISDIRELPVQKKYEKYLKLVEERVKACWGVSVPKNSEERGLERVELIISVPEGEEYIIQRLQREKRKGRVEPAGEDNWKFTAEVTDAKELIPWIRTFIGRIVKFECSNPAVTDHFFAGLGKMREDYR